jgi:hypothetical protein
VICHPTNSITLSSRPTPLRCHPERSGIIRLRMVPKSRACPERLSAAKESNGDLAFVFCVAPPGAQECRSPERSRRAYLSIGTSSKAPMQANSATDGELRPKWEKLSYCADAALSDRTPGEVERVPSRANCAVSRITYKVGRQLTYLFKEFTISNPCLRPCAFCKSGNTETALAFFDWGSRSSCPTLSQTTRENGTQTYRVFAELSR